MQIDRRGPSKKQEVDGKYAARIVSGSALSLALLVGSPALAESGLPEAFRSPTQSITSTANRAGEVGLRTAESAGESTAADAWRVLKHAGEVGAEKMGPIAESAAKEALKGLQYAGEVGIKTVAPLAKSAATEAWKVVSNSVSSSAKNAGIIGESKEVVVDIATGDPASSPGKSVSDYFRARFGLPEAKKAPPVGQEDVKGRTGGKEAETGKEAEKTSKPSAEFDSAAKESKSSEKPGGKPEEAKDSAKTADQERTDDKGTGPAAAPGAKEAQEKVDQGKEAAAKVESESSKTVKTDKVGDAPAGGQEIAGDVANEQKKEGSPGMVTTQEKTSEQKETVSTTDAVGETPSVENVQAQAQEIQDGAPALAMEKKPGPIQVNKECTCPARAEGDAEVMTTATGELRPEDKGQGGAEASPALTVKTSEEKKEVGSEEIQKSSVEAAEEKQQSGTETSQGPSSTASEDKKLVAARDNKEPDVKTESRQLDASQDTARSSRREQRTTLAPE
ncbi:hypothetical protein NDN08_008055 [Rhodosorus marinus]|uniref:Uncharacterized protein n=1 Tax=Rhodosorus marinus TaxID=101924 RepID=A0AAV8V2W8_9RHOD|nr:hypothetical protein NDN08_008055 [Rhodosorus marinus]